MHLEDDQRMNVAQAAATYFRRIRLCKIDRKPKDEHWPYDVARLIATFARVGLQDAGLLRRYKLPTGSKSVKVDGITTGVTVSSSPKRHHAIHRNHSSGARLLWRIS
jgi:hypothetical protein